jgi:hypothetical protein
MLWRPTLPDPFPALKVIERELEAGAYFKKGSRAVTHLGTELLRTLLILNLQNATSEAEWARSTLKKKFGKVWGDRQRNIDAWVKDPTLQHFPESWPLQVLLLTTTKVTVS